MGWKSEKNSRMGSLMSFFMALTNRWAVSETNAIS